MRKQTGSNLGSFVRLGFLVAGIIAQIALLFAMTLRIRTGSVLYFALQIVGVVVILVMLNRYSSPSHKIGWLLVIFMLPIFGLFIYFLWGNTRISRREHTHYEQAYENGFAQMPVDEEVVQRLSAAYPIHKRNVRFLANCGYPIYENTPIEYFDFGEKAFDRIIEDIEKAKKFVFIDFFIIGIGELWDTFYEVLKRKVQEGVEVRIIYDDMGSLLTLADGFRKQLRADGIQVEVFNPIHRYVIRLEFNYRSHQKIIVVDGDVAYTGGINIADEYANIYPKHGMWKDTAIRMEGEACWSLTVMFLQMWDYVRHEVTQNYEAYRPSLQVCSEQKNFMQIYADSPADDVFCPARGLYEAFAEQAQRSLYITTPYFVVEDSIVEALCRASHSGVDVRMITPAVPDHWYVHEVTRSFYGQLMESGVRIYEYTPGFIHAKMVVMDDEAAIIGTINYDFRSFYMQFENAALIYDEKIVQQVKQDILDTMEISQEQDLQRWKKRGYPRRVVAATLRLLAPLM